MQSAKDQVQAHQFTERRLAAALVLGDASGAVAPARRATVGLVSGLVVAVLAAGVFFVLGLLSPGSSTAWRQQGAIVVEKETGTRYVLVKDVLRPVRNLSSAALVTGGMKIVTVSRKSLAGVPHGAPVGLPDAPDVVPEASALHSGPVALCTPTRAGQDVATTLVLDPAVSVSALPAGVVATVTAPDGARHLVVDGKRHEVTDRVASAAFGLDALPAVAVTKAWLDTVPKGEPIAPYAPENAGSQGRRVAGATGQVGALFRVGEQHYVMLTDGLAALSTTDFTLASARGAAVKEVSAADVAGTDRSATSLVGRLPDLVRATHLRSDGSGLCVSSATDGSAAAPVIGLVDAGALRPGKPGTFAVNVPPGGGVVAVSGAVPVKDRDKWRVLVTETGVRHLMPTERDVSSLGYRSVVPMVVPDAVMNTMPPGAVLTAASVSI
ncbi:type VII secretion protein EccB [Lentzea sp. NPDC058436]|uniref:type VII secretion protein EccB n=1 Tax=Lentzea sp. NPDC058436 TaxID=3346499 RepID=UPI00364BE24B